MADTHNIMGMVMVEWWILFLYIITFEFIYQGPSSQRCNLDLLPLQSWTLHHWTAELASGTSWEPWNLPTKKPWNPQTQDQPVESLTLPMARAGEDWLYLDELNRLGQGGYCIGCGAAVFCLLQADFDSFIGPLKADFWMFFRIFKIVIKRQGSLSLECLCFKVEMQRRFTTRAAYHRWQRPLIRQASSSIAQVISKIIWWILVADIDGTKETSRRFLICFPWWRMTALWNFSAHLVLPCLYIYIHIYLTCCTYEQQQGRDWKRKTQQLGSQNTRSSKDENHL